MHIYVCLLAQSLYADVVPRFQHRRFFLPRKSLEGGSQESIPQQDSGFQKWRSPLKALLDEFTRSNTMAWFFFFFIALKPRAE